MISAQQQATLRGANCEIAFDNLTRQLYATDASIYQITPVAVAFPANTRQASALIDAAVQAGVTVIPRGAGTGLVGRGHRRRPGHRFLPLQPRRSPTWTWSGARCGWGRGWCWTT